MAEKLEKDRFIAEGLQIDENPINSETDTTADTQQFLAVQQQPCTSQRIDEFHTMDSYDSDDSGERQKLSREQKQALIGKISGRVTIESWLQNMPDSIIWADYQKHLDNLIVQAVEVACNSFYVNDDAVSDKRDLKHNTDFRDASVVNFIRYLVIQYQVTLDDSPFRAPTTRLDKLEMEVGTPAVRARIEEYLPNSEFLYNTKKSWLTAMNDHTKQIEDKNAKLNMKLEQLTLSNEQLKDLCKDTRSELDRLDTFFHDLREKVETQDERVPNNPEESEPTEPTEMLEAPEAIKNKMQVYPFSFEPDVSNIKNGKDRLTREELKMVRCCVIDMCGPDVVELLHVWEKALDADDLSRLRPLARKLINPLQHEPIGPRLEQNFNFKCLLTNLMQLAQLMRCPSEISLAVVMEIITKIAGSAHDLLGPESRIFTNMQTIRDRCSLDAPTYGEIMKEVYRAMPDSLKGNQQLRCLKMYQNMDKSNYRATDWKDKQVHFTKHGVYVDLMPPKSPFIGRDTPRKFTLQQLHKSAQPNALKRDALNRSGTR